MQNEENAREHACMSVQKMMFHHNNTPKLLCQMSDNGGFKRVSHPNRIKKEKKLFFFKSAVVPHLNITIPQMHYTFLMYEKYSN